MAGHTFSSLHFHLVWGTAKREPFLHPGVWEKLPGYIHGIVSNLGGTLLDAGGMPDHAHALVDLRPDKAVAEVAGKIKSNSSRWIHETFPEIRGFAWQEGYGVFSVSKSSVPDVIEYIRKQAEHHKVRSFREEYLALLKKHGIPFDERYVLG
jgi:REP element-mobilizing transposase RayT